MEQPHAPQMSVSNGDNDIIWETSLTEGNPASATLWLLPHAGSSAAAEPNSTAYGGPLKCYCGDAAYVWYY